MAISTVRKGRDEVRGGARPDDVVNVRRSTGKRSYEAANPEVWPALERLVDPLTRGDPESPLRWTCKSTHVLAAEMFAQYGIRISDKTVAKLLREHGYSLQAPNKSVEGAQHPDRNAQFEHINARAKRSIKRGVPVISVDTKKKELIGNFANGGREWQPQGEPELVDVHDFPGDAVGEAIPYGVYDVAANDGFVSVGVDHDTPVFAVTSIEGMVEASRRETLSERGRDLHHCRCWRQQWLPLAGMEARAPALCRQARHRRVSHFPPGTSKWNKVEHRLFSFISMNWRGRPLRSYETIVSLIGNTTNRGGLVVRARLDRRRYAIGKKVTNKEFRELKIEPDTFHGDWNYVIRPRLERR